MSPQPGSLEYDVIIVGSGLSGCATALSLIKTNTAISLLLIDDSESDVFKIGESLPPESISLLRHLSSSLHSKLSEDISLGRHLKCTGNASAWSSPSVHEIHSIMNPFGMGLHLDRARFDETMRETVNDMCQKGEKSSIGMKVLKKAKALQVEWNSTTGRHQVTLQESDQIATYSSSWIIDATGRKASVARQLGAKTIKSDSLLSFYALFSSSISEIDRDNRTLIEASPTGWWYTSKLSENRRIIAYHTDDTDSTCKIARKPSGFLELLQNGTIHINRIVEEHEYEIMNGFPKTTAANSSHLEPSHNFDEGPKWCAVGDAAMAFDPLSSQGMMTALRMGMIVGSTIGYRLKLGGVREEGDDEPWNQVPDLQEAFEKVQKGYDKHKKYYYGVVKRFDGEFWMKRRG